MVQVQFRKLIYFYFCSKLHCWCCVFRSLYPEYLQNHGDYDRALDEDSKSPTGTEPSCKIETDGRKSPSAGANHFDTETVMDGRRSIMAD